MRDRPVYGTRKYRATDLEAGDVVRNRYGKWDVVTKLNVHEDGKYVEIGCEVGGAFSVRTVHLVDVQVVKPS